MKGLKVERSVLFGFGAALAIMLAIGALAYLSISQFSDTTREALRNAEFIIPLQSVELQVQRATAAHRRFLLTDEPVDLAARESAVADTERALESLRNAARSFPGLDDELDDIERLAQERIRLLDRVLRVHRTQGAAKARALLAGDRGEQQMAALQAEVKELLRDRQSELAAARQTPQRETRDSLVAILVLFFFATALLSVLMYLIHNAMQTRNRAHEALASSEARLQAVLDTAVDAIIVIDESGVIQTYNNAAERIFGFTAEEAVGRNVSMLMPSPYREEHDGYLEHYLKTGERRVIGIGREVLGQHKDGRIFPMDLSVAEFFDGRERRFSGIVRDITERKHAQQRMGELIAELKVANEELKSFAYVASHDLKAPLRAISTLAEWISQDYADQFDDEGREQMRLLIGRVRRMDRLIDGILEYSRIGRVREAPEPVDLNPLVAEVLDLLAPPPEIQVEITDLPALRIERVRIQQVFQNLISNAVKYMDKPQGTVRVGWRPEGDSLHFTVEDNGPGIEARHFDRIFGMFQTLVPRDRYESTGLGLALVKKIIETHGGMVWVTSVPGKGSTFHFTLPQNLSA